MHGTLLQYAYPFPITRAMACFRQVRLSFEWDITAKGLLGLQLEAMERVLVQRLEILCMLDPVPASRAIDWALQKSRKQARKVGIV